MNKENIIKIIEANPERKYEDLKNHAMFTGITAEEFDNAWNEHLRKSTKPSESKIVTQAYIIILLVLSITGFDTAYWKFLIRITNEIFAANFGILALFTSFILLMHLASKFTGSRTSIGYTTKLSIFLFILTYLAHLSSLMTSTITYIIILFGGVIAGTMAIYAIIRIYKIDFPRFLLLTLITGIMMGIIIQFTIGFKIFKGYFVPAGGIQIEEMESAVDIANE